MQTDNRLTEGRDWPLSKKLQAQGGATHHNPLLVRKFPVQHPCGYFLVPECVGPAMLPPTPELVRLNVWPSFCPQAPHGGAIMLPQEKWASSVFEKVGIIIINPAFIPG